MKRVTYLLSLFFFACAFGAGNLSAQDFDISDYLKGAVPTVDGKVVFSKSFEAPGMSRDSLMKLTERWIGKRDDPQENRSSKVLLTDGADGAVVGGCREKLVFKSKALYVDQANVNYYINAVCKEGAVKLEIFRISYLYGEKERFTAEELITDEVSLNKEGDNIVKQSYKWRVKTVDFANNLFHSYGTFLSKNMKK